ncbi:hypothetical protein [Myroides indicus]|uniref:Outer membrane protein with beta-barrel domain n=1 Tax=Myroides indicus TaxID=1323422 RepID=A0A4R7ES68_9FLAO|nr:hypothetical protein [Myroides indicus]TDS56594.1 hypothetical protein C8P70_11930 [Myroides indicus]
MDKKHNNSGLFKIVVLLSLFISVNTMCVAQEKTKSFINFGFQGFEASVNVKLYNDFNLELFGGTGLGYNISEKENGRSGFDVNVGYEKLVPFIKGALKWDFVNNENGRIYLSLQSKYSFGSRSDSYFEKVNLTEINCGIDRFLTKRLLFNGHLGIGYFQGIDINEGGTSLTLGATLKYNIIKF